MAHMPGVTPIIALATKQSYTTEERVFTHVNKEKYKMNQYPAPEPQRPQAYNPYPYNPYTSQTPPPENTSEPTYGSQQSQRQYNEYANNPQNMANPVSSKKLSTQIWDGLVRFLGKRGLLVAAGAVLATLAFFMPYYSIFSGYYLAAETLDDKWWLELILPLVALAVVIVRQTVPRLKQQKRSSSLIIAGSGILGVLIHYWFLSGIISTNYWRFGTWTYLLGMAIVAIGGLLSLL
jgi:hypothetical protein